MSAINLLSTSECLTVIHYNGNLVSDERCLFNFFSLAGTRQRHSLASFSIHKLKIRAINSRLYIGFVVAKVTTEDGDEQSKKKETGTLKTCAALRKERYMNIG